MTRLLWLLLIVTRLRDRLRCPNCKAVGTYKLHAPCPDGKGGKRPFRWLCKWCGYYRGPEGEGELGCPSPTFGCWIFLSQAEGYKGRTPQELVEDGAYEDWCEAKKYIPAPSPKSPYEPWPWRG